jgi:hypothetical protein
MESLKSSGGATDTRHMDDGTHHSVKRVRLPSGRTIEVVSFEDAPRPRRDEAGPVEDLSRCIRCDSPLVQPVSWEEAAGGTWRVLVRCPECETWRDDEFDQVTVEAFDAALDAGTDELTCDYRQLCRANMSDEIDRFVAAVDAGAIAPEDF